MTTVFKTAKDYPHDVEIVGVGLLQPFGGNALSVERAAQVMVELQDEKGAPLSGAKLTAAAKDWAEKRQLEVGNAAEAKVVPDPLEPEPERVADEPVTLDDGEDGS